MSKKSKSFFSRFTIAHKITMMYGGIFSLSLLIISFFVLVNVTVIEQNNIKEEMKKTVENIDDYIKNGGELSQETLEALLENKYIEVNVVDVKNHKVYKNSVGKLPSFVRQIQSQPPPHGFLEEERNNRSEELEKKGFKVDIAKEFNMDDKAYFISGRDGKEFVLLEKEINFEENCYLVQAFKMLQKNDYYFRSFGLRLFLIDILGIFLSFLIGRYISRRMLKPVEEIQQTAERISIEDLSQRIDTSGPDDEMKELAETFNSMISRLENSFQKQNQFISDASHELRTPISVIQGYANLINLWGKSDPTVLEESIQSILAETEHMSQLIKKLLFLAKSDQNRIPVQKEQFCLNELVKEVVKEMEITTETKRNIIIKEQKTVEIYADSSMIKQLLWIHCENALKYTKQNDSITFHIYEQCEYGCVDVQDNGVGMNEEDVTRIFDRFYRADKSRNKEIPGTGLGLSIAKWIAESNDGKISVESELEKGTIFHNAFPLKKKKNQKHS